MTPSELLLVVLGGAIALVLAFALVVAMDALAWAWDRLGNWWWNLHFRRRHRG